MAKRLTDMAFNSRHMHENSDKELTMALAKQTYFQDTLLAVESDAIFFGLKLTANKAREIYNNLDLLWKPERLRPVLRELEARMREELHEAQAVHIPASHIRYLKAENIFGPEAVSAFPKLTSHMESAGSCYAVECYAACVFHLMLIMETTVEVLSKDLGIMGFIQRTKKIWAPMMKEISAKIAANKTLNLKTKKGQKRQEFHEKSEAFLAAIRQPWRNETMHPASEYSRADAALIFDSVVLFTQHLAKNIKKKTTA